MDVDEVSENPEDIEDQNLIFMIDKRRMTDKNLSICLKINIHIQKLIVLQTQKFYHWKGQKYMLCMSTILKIENFLKIKENQDQHLKN